MAGKKFPRRWLTYKQRIGLDVDRAYKQHGGKEFFNEKYEADLAGVVRELERWQIRLAGLQTALFAFLIIGLLGRYTTISFLGVSIRDEFGLKELLAVFTSTISFLTLIVTASKEMRIFVIENLVDLKSPHGFRDFAILSSRSSFHMQVYFAKTWDQFLFSTILTKVLFFALALLVSLVTLSLLLGSMALQVGILILVWENPSFGIWSEIIVGYGIVVFLIGLLWLGRLLVPLPFQDEATRRQAA